MSTAKDKSKIVFTPDEDRVNLSRLETLLEKAHPRLLGMDGEEILLPEQIYLILREVTHLMLSGQAVSLLPYDHLLTTQEAADLLNISRPYLYTLLDKGEIPYVTVGTHRRIHMQNLMAYQEKRDNQRRQALDQLSSFSQELGFYDMDNHTPVKEAGN